MFFVFSGSRRPWACRIVDLRFHSKSTIFFRFFEKERPLNPSVMYCEKTLDKNCLKFETQMN